jgi:hypothetical protein
MLQEQYEALEKAAASFFASEGDSELSERRALAVATKRSITRDGD